MLENLLNKFRKVLYIMKTLSKEENLELIYKGINNKIHHFRVSLNSFSGELENVTEEDSDDKWSKINQEINSI